MFRADRIFSLKKASSGATEWFFLAREGIMGPYVSKEEASRNLVLFVQWCMGQQQTGGRPPAKGVDEEPQPATELA